MTRAFSTAAALLVAALGLSAQARAQNYDAALQARFGTFFQGAGVRGHAKVEPTLDTDGPFSYFSKGIGFATGLDLVNKRAMTFGLEADAAFMDGNTNRPGQQFGVDWLLTFRARAGVHVRPDVLWYASTGPALAGYDLVTTQKIQRTRWGWSFGTGLEWDYGGGILFGEYLFAGLSDADFLSSGSVFNYDMRSHAMRFGLKFKLGHDHYHDDVAERIGRRHTSVK